LGTFNFVKRIITFRKLTSNINYTYYWSNY